jgi:hypothetical protein
MVEWFALEYIYVKMCRRLNLRLKAIIEVKIINLRLKSIIEVKILNCKF